MRDELIDNIVYGSSAASLADDVKSGLEARIRATSQDLDKIKSMATINSYENMKKGKMPGKIGPDDQSYSNIINLINQTNSNSVSDFNSILDNIFEKNKKYFSILKDYEIMPILIPQINRILMFLVNECISPDIQSNRTFSIINNTENSSLTEEINKIRDELELDKLLQKVYDNRFKLGKEYYVVTDYKRTFEVFKSRLQQRPLNEATGQTCNEFDYLNESFSSFKVIDNTVINESVSDIDDVNLSQLNIEIERTDMFERINEVKMGYINETYRANSIKTILNEASGMVSEDKITSLVDYLSKKDIDNCSITRLDPARVFKLAPSGKTVGYFYITDNNPKTKKNSDSEAAKLLRDRLIKSRSVGNNKTNGESESVAEKQIVEKLAEKIINTFDPNIGISNIKDIDLLYDYMLHNNIMEGNKKVIFYYADDVVDLSRSDDSILINAVFFTKLYATLLLNNIATKILRGRGRQIHTVNVGVSPSLNRYIENAISTLTMPQTNLGSITGSFRNLLNPLNSSSDIVIPTENEAERYITTDLIEGQNVDMDSEMLKFLINSIVLSFGLDSATIDTTNGNVDFAKTLSILSYQIANSVKNEQTDLFPGWNDMVLSVLEIMGSDELKQAVANGEIECSFFAPHSLMLNMRVDEMNSAKQYADSLADIIPDFIDGDESTNLLRAEFVYTIIKNEVNLDWGEYDEIIKNLSPVAYKLKKDIANASNSAKENTQEQDIDDIGSLTDEDEDLGDDF